MKKPRKIKISHHEVEVKLFLEIMAVYGILAIALAGVYLLEPTITGFITVAKQINYVDNVNLEFNETREYVWNLSNPGNLKGIKIDGSKSIEGEIKVFIENDNVRYLIFDSSQLVEKETGIFGVTGFVVKENKSDSAQKKQEVKENPETPRDNNPPVWKSDIEEFVINDVTVIDLNDYFSDKNNDTIFYFVSIPENIEVSLNNNLLTLTPLDNNFNTSINITATDLDKSTTKEIALIVSDNKIISINLQYKSGSIYDTDDDGVETITGTVDLTVENTNFNWDVDDNNLCTRYEVYSIESQESSFACYGNAQCCAFADLQNSREFWNDTLFLTYDGDSENVVSAQVLHVDFDLSSEQPYSDVVISEQANLTVKFVDNYIYFEDVCVETCSVSGFNATEYRIIVEIEDGELTIDNIDYIIEEISTNQNPLLINEIENVSIIENGNFTLDLSQYFSDEDKLSYSYLEIDNISIRFEDDLAYIIPDKGFVGSEFTFITANDSVASVLSNVFEIEVVKKEEPTIQILDSIIADGNWNVRFNTVGIGTLTISAVNATYAEYFNDNITTINDLDILELKCGDFEFFNKENLIDTENFWFILENNSKVKLIDLIGESLPIKSVYVEDYSCDEIGQYTVKLLTEGIHTQEFNFENKNINVKSIPFSEQTIDISTDTFEIRDEEGNILAVFDSSGNVNIKGFLVQLIADDDDFVIENVDGSLNLVITNPEGNMLIKGNLNENQDLLIPTPDSFILENETGAIAVYVNSTGSLFLRGKITERVLFE